MDQNLKAYEGFLNNIIENPNYVATAEENTAAYNIQSDVTYADLSNELQGCQSYEEQLSVLKKYVKEDEFNNERLNFDDAVQGEEKDQLESIIMKNKAAFGIQDDLSVIKDNIVRFASNSEQIEIELDRPGLENYRDFYRTCVDEYTGKKADKYDNDKEQAKGMGLSYTNPDLNNHGYINLLFMAIVLTAIAFIVLFKLF